MANSYVIFYGGTNGQEAIWQTWIFQDRSKVIIILFFKGKFNRHPPKRPMQICEEIISKVINT
jgi:hypothetical protein